MAAGDVLMLDTGAVWDGYFCDYDRNFAIGHATAEQSAAHARLIEAASALGPSARSVRARTRRSVEKEVSKAAKRRAKERAREARYDGDVQKTP